MTPSPARLQRRTTPDALVITSWRCTARPAHGCQAYTTSPPSSTTVVPWVFCRRVVQPPAPALRPWLLDPGPSLRTNGQGRVMHLMPPSMLTGEAQPDPSLLGWTRPADDSEMPRRDQTITGAGLVHHDDHHDRRRPCQDGLFAKDKFCLTRRGRLVRPKRRVRSGADRAYPTNMTSSLNSSGGAICERVVSRDNCGRQPARRTSFPTPQQTILSQTKVFETAGATSAVLVASADAAGGAGHPQPLVRDILVGVIALHFPVLLELLQKFLH